MRNCVGLILERSIAGRKTENITREYNRTTSLTGGTKTLFTLSFNKHKNRRGGRGVVVVAVVIFLFFVFFVTGSYG